MEDKKGKAVKIFNFNETYEAPVNKWNDKKGMVEWGSDNLYPNYLLETYQTKGGSLHQSIINKKSKLISGKGFEDVLSPELSKFIKDNKLDSEVKKITLDYEIYNGFALEIIWNREGTKIVEVQHIPFFKLRMGIENENIPYPHVWFSNDWSQCRKDMYKPEHIRLYNPRFNKGKQIYYYCEYSPSNDIYPTAGYSSSMNWIEMSYEVSSFHLNQLKNGYAPSFILNFSTGIPTEEEQDEFFKHFKRNYSGSKGETLIITYSEGENEKPELIPLNLNDSDERFIMLNEQIQSSIAQGHEIPIQLVQLQPGKLGSSEERLELMTELQSFYVTPRQETIESVLNDIINGGNISDEGLQLKQFNK